MENWKKIENYDWYWISDKGRVWSTKTNKFLSLLNHKVGSGYWKVSLSKDGKCTQYSVHRLVAQAFIPNPENKPQVNHIDENGKNNCVENLEWTTSKENMNHGTRTERANKAKMKPILQYTKDNEFIKEWSSQKEACEVLGLNKTNLNSVLKGKYGYSSYKGFKFKYKEAAE